MSLQPLFVQQVRTDVGHERSLYFFGLGIVRLRNMFVLHSRPHASPALVNASISDQLWRRAFSHVGFRPLRCAKFAALRGRPYAGHKFDRVCRPKMFSHFGLNPVQFRPWFFLAVRDIGRVVRVRKSWQRAGYVLFRASMPDPCCSYLCSCFCFTFGTVVANYRSAGSGCARYLSHIFRTSWLDPRCSDHCS